MTRLWKFFSRHGAACLGMAVFTVCVLIVFFPALPKFVALVSPDAGPFFTFANRTHVIEGLLTGETFTPHTLYWLFLNPLYTHELTYVIDSLALALAGVYYLTGRRVLPLAAWCGGLALGFSGYTFTLFSAGHRGYFHMIACALWAFGLLIRCFETRKLFYFAMLGIVFAWSVPFQPDVLVMVGAVAAAYAVWLTFCDPKQAVRRITAVWPRFSVSVLVLVLAGFGGLRSAVTTQITSREAQISGGAAQGDKTGEKKPEKMSDAEKHSRWIFATNWSLPPEDLVEFIAPGVFGDESMQMPYPYWGRLGRPCDEEFQKGRMMPNYRQHTVYLGVVPILFALVGVMAWVLQRKERELSPVREAADYSDVPFWCAVWVVCLLLAMGRYTPFYRLFYAIPYMGYIRDPVKFHHLVELATAFLAGFGVDAFLRLERPVLRRRLLWMGVGMAGLLLMGTLVSVVARPQIVRHITELGMGQVAAALGGYAVQNLVRSACLALLVAGLAYASLRKGVRTLAWMGCVLLAVLALDQAWVASRYVRVIDVEPFYRENAAVKAIRKTASGQFVNVVNYATANAWAQEWFSTSLAMYGIRNLALSGDERDTPYGKLFLGLQNDPVRLWHLLNVQFVIVQRKMCEPFLRAGVLTPVLDFELGAGFVRQVTPDDKSLIVARVRDTVPGPRLVAGWQGGVPIQNQVEASIHGQSDVSDAPPPASLSAEGGAGEFHVLTSRGLPGEFATRIRVKAKASGLLIFDERLAAKQEVLVDGKRATLCVADAIWPAVSVPVGEHEIVFRKTRSYTLFVLSGLMSLTLLVWAFAAWVRGRRSVTVGNAAV